METRGLGMVKRTYHRRDADRPAQGGGPIRGGNEGGTMPSFSVLPEASDVKHQTKQVPLPESRVSSPVALVASSRRRWCSNADRVRLSRTQGVLDAVEMSIRARDALAKALLAQPLSHSHRPRDGQTLDAQPLQYDIGPLG